MNAHARGMSDKNIIKPEWLSINDSSIYSGLSGRCLQNYVADKLVVAAHVKRPGATRGRTLIERKSLDDLIRRSIGEKATIAMNSKQK